MIAAPRVLVVTASKHGSTTEVGHFIAQKLQDYGFHTVSMLVSEVESLAGWDAVVLGSAVYNMNWLAEANDFLSRFEAELSSLALWVFSMAMTGLPEGEVESPSRMKKRWEGLTLRGNKTFAGRISLTDLNLMERSIITMVRSPEGDHRPWAEIEAYVEQICLGLRPDPTTEIA